MTAGFILVALLTYYIQDYPLAHLFLPLSFWAACRFRMHGATLSTFFLMIVMVIPTALGRGPYIVGFGDPVLLIVSYIEVIAALTLFLSALLNERDTALDTLQHMRIEEESRRITYTEEGGEDKQIAVPLDVVSLSLSLAQDLDIRFDQEHMTVTPKEQANKLRVRISFRK